LQVIAIVVGGVWVLVDYFEFKNKNNELINTQLKLSNESAQLTQSSIAINNQLNQIKLAHSGQKRLESTGESSVVLASKFEDGTALYRFQFRVFVKNISESNVLIPALVVEFFLGTTTTIKNLQPQTAFLINQPSSWIAATVPGRIDWSKISVNAMRLDRIDGEIANKIKDFPRMSGGFCGELRSGESANWNADFVLRAHPEDIAGAVATYWARGEGDEYFVDTQTRTELLSEAEDTLSLKTTTPLKPEGAAVK
jgi:hypothetical protein